MKNLKGKIALFILLCTWLVLGWLTGARIPWQELGVKQQNKNEITIHLGDIPSENYDRMGFTKAILAYCEAVNGWIVGTERGELFLFDSKGKQVWKRSLGLGKLVSLCLSKDGTLAYVGETSQQGQLFAINIATGSLAWKLNGSDFVGSDPSQRSNPSIVHIVVDEQENVYANIYRFLAKRNGTRTYQGKMVSLTKAGQERWHYPADENMDSWINWCSVSNQDDRVVISTSAYDFRPEMKFKDTMYFLNKSNGELLNSVFLEPIPPFNNTVMRGSPNYSTQGHYLAAAASDGRGFLMDEKGALLWQRTLSKPSQIDGTWINASGRDGYVWPEGVFFTTINTFNRENWQLPTPVEHPANNSLFAFSLEGKYKYQYKADGTMEDLSFAAGKVACAIGRNVRTHNYKAHGALLLDLASGKKLEFMATEGPCQAIALSTDGQQMAAVEAPAVTPQGKILGAYRLYIWKLGKKND